MNLFVDTNIIIDYLDERPGFAGSARKLMLLGFLREFDLWMSSSQVIDMFYILTNGGHPSKAEGAKASSREVRKFVRVCSLGEADIDTALDSTWSDFEDACVYQCARKIRADAIITRNKKDFEKSSIKVFDCEEWFSYLAQSKGLTYEEIPF